MIEFDQVSYRYPQATGVEKFSLQVAAGECVALIGPSGCGKSTVLKLAAGLLQPDTGRIVSAGIELATRNVLEVRRRIGYVIQSGGLFPHLSAEANVSLAARHFGREPAWIEARMLELAELVRMPRDALRRLPQDLSGGQRQRVGLMRALMLEPDVLLLDEPLGALDPMVRHDLQEDLRTLFRALQRTVLLVTHDLAEAAFFSRRLVLMRTGAIVQQGSIDDLAADPAEDFVREFVRAQRVLRGLDTNG